MNIHRLRHFIKEYYTLDNIVLLAALLMALGFIWSTMSALQSNYVLQRQVDVLKSEVEASRLQASNLELENAYFASNEYQELQARKKFGKAASGEHMLILSPNTVSDTNSDTTSKKLINNSNFQSWMDFFFSTKKPASKS